MLPDPSTLGFDWPGLVTGAYLAILLVLAIYGFHRSHLVYLYFKHKARRPRPAGSFAEPPAVTVQLPLYNEMYVAERLLDACAAIRWPRDRFQIQVLDDSTDETRALCRAKVEALRARHPELDIEYVHRTDRTGFKAGALDNGLATAKGEFVFIFDADFLPPADIVERSMPYFADPKVGVVQCRWEHVNRDFSALTEVQALMLDGHFLVEHAGRNWSGRFFNFNGTAGAWRKAVIADAGGWQHDTLTEDMDLSYRAQLKGWRFVYAPEIAAPAELPVEMSSFKSQQFRWAKGSIQVGKKLLPTILRSNATRAQKIEAFFHLTNNLSYPLLFVLAVLLLPTLVFRTEHGIREVLTIDLPLFFGTTLSIASFYLASQRELAALSGDGRNPVWPSLRRLPLLLSLGIGLCVNQSRAVIEALLGRETEFVRTPKHGIKGRLGSFASKKYRAARSLTPFIELGMAAYFVVAIKVAIANGHYLSTPFLALFLFGFGYVGAVSLAQGAPGQAVRGAVARVFRRGARIVPPPAFPVLAAAGAPAASAVTVPAAPSSPRTGSRAQAPAGSDRPVPAAP